MKYLLIIILSFLETANAASFDCKKASTWVERQICSNPLLNKLDDAMNKNFLGSKSTNIGRKAENDLKMTQKKWLRERELCKTVQCIESVYRRRINDLCEYPAVSGVNYGCAVTSDEIN